MRLISTIAKHEFDRGIWSAEVADFLNIFRPDRFMFLRQSLLRRTATSRDPQTHAVVCCDQREARHHWFKHPIYVRHKPQLQELRVQL